MRWFTWLFVVIWLQTPFAFGQTETQDKPQQGDLDILVVNMARILTEAGAYIAIQAETERVRALIDEEYQSRLDALQGQVADLRAQESEMAPEAFDSARRDLENQAEELQLKRQENINQLEAGRTRAIVLVDQRLQGVFDQIIEETGASYIVSQQVLVLWPRAADITDRAIELMDAALPTVNFNVSLTLQDDNAGQDNP